MAFFFFSAAKTIDLTIILQQKNDDTEANDFVFHNDDNSF